MNHSNSGHQNVQSFCVSSIRISTVVSFLFSCPYFNCSPVKIYFKFTSLITWKLCKSIWFEFSQATHHQRVIQVKGVPLKSCRQGVRIVSQLLHGSILVDRLIGSDGFIQFRNRLGWPERLQILFLQVSNLNQEWPITKGWKRENVYMLLFR